ncbi:hypothetical protein V1517DRAFT_321935 [Lipomyces orientalis]|uniref:Uncharacterized protein n=1 Tax=Lipomyces orientalis TaxID=1233043 RepID=A0ACC3TNU2_9ASCO
MVASSEANNGFSVPSVLENTQSTVYRWASDSPPSLKHATELSRLSEGEDTLEPHHQLNHITRLAKLLDKFNLNHPSPASVRSMLDSPSRISTPLSDSLIYSSSMSGWKNRSVSKKVTDSNSSLVDDTGSPREHIRYSDESAHRQSSSPPDNEKPLNNAVSQPVGDAPRVSEVDNRSQLSAPSSETVSHRSQPKPEERIPQVEKGNRSLVQDHSVPSAFGYEDQLTREDYIFLLKQLRGLSQECDTRGKYIEELERRDVQQQAQQPLSHTMYVEPPSPRQLNDLESPVAQPLRPIEQSSANSQFLRRVVLEDASAIASPISYREEVSFPGIAELARSREGGQSDEQQSNDIPTTIPMLGHHAEQPAVIHTQPVRSHHSQIVDKSPVRLLPSLLPTVSASHNDDRSAFTRRHEIGARNPDEVQLLESLNDSLRHSLKLEHDLEQAKSEIADLRSLVRELSKKDRDPSSQRHSHIESKAAPFDINDLRQSKSVAPPTTGLLRAAEPLVSVISGERSLSSSMKEPVLAGNDRGNTLHSHRSKGYERATSVEVIEELEKLLAEAEKEIAILKGNAKILGPSAMPDARRVTAFKHDKLYYRLQMDQVDSLGVSELGNLIKNVLLQFSTPLSKLPERVMLLNSHLQSEERYMHFANDIHAALYGGNQMHPGPAGSQEELQCLGEMVGRVEKLARAAERRSKKSMANIREH